jgi:hypothetical protein
LGDNHGTKTQMMNAVLHPVSGNKMQYKDIMQHPTLGPKYKTGFGNELGRLWKGIRDIQGTNTCFFVELSNITKDQKLHMENLFAVTNQIRRKKSGFDQQLAATGLIKPAKWQHPQLT